MVLRLIVSTVKRSVARIPDACERRNSVHVGPARRGAGSRPCRRRIVRTVVAEILISSFSSSPRIRWYPHRGFSLPRRTTRSRTSGSIGGRPCGPDRLCVHFFLTSSRCQRSRVSDFTTKEDQLLLVIALLAAANRTRSRRLSRGRFTCRCSTLTWCRSTRCSMSFSLVGDLRLRGDGGPGSTRARTAWSSFR